MFSGLKSGDRSDFKDGHPLIHAQGTQRLSQNLRRAAEQGDEKIACMRRHSGFFCRCITQKADNCLLSQHSLEQKSAAETGKIWALLSFYN
jgi:hypothetical protein